MKLLRLIISFFIFCLLHLEVSAQKNNFTGRWEGIIDGEFMQLNIEHTKTRFCVYSYDYVLGQKETSYCRASYETYFLKEEGSWFIRGNRMLANSGTHDLMQIKLWRSPGDAPNKLRASIASSGLNLAFHDSYSKLLVFTRVDRKPIPLPGLSGVCPDSPKEQIPETKPKPKTVPAPAPKPKAPPKKTEPNPTRPPVAPPEVPTPKPTPKTEPIPQKDSTAIKLRQMNARKQSEQSRLTVNVKEISLKLYDNGVVDNDIISVFYNGRLLVSNQKLSEQAIELKIKLDENTRVHEITLYAENLGEIPPNTALIIVTAGKKRYELRSKADLQENAVLVFEYQAE